MIGMLNGSKMHFPKILLKILAICNGIAELESF